MAAILAMRITAATVVSIHSFEHYHRWPLFDWLGEAGGPVAIGKPTPRHYIGRAINSTTFLLMLAWGWARTRARARAAAVS